MSHTITYAWCCVRAIDASRATAVLALWASLICRWLDGQCQLNFVTDRDATDTALWDLRLESPRDLHRTMADGRDHQSTALVELYGWHVVIRRDEPEPLTVRRACCSLGRCEQGRTDPLAFCK